MSLHKMTNVVDRLAMAIVHTVLLAALPAAAFVFIAHSI
ncbi:hypothetical protein QO010_003494 [Caulobacter ginsengisoli]|uniref:Uncharacterized protein n=1 Tax=Caulobacter ginsengisoli TaxID=400775 RepID=A0ABU0IWE6_9CAUL|nr:hypothetical protein [Caulobacter ginsengisoli]